MTQTGELTRLLDEASRGDRDAADRLVPILYDELRRIAHRRMRGERSGHTLDTTALVHEAYLELAGLDQMEWRSRAHFLAVAAIAMRRVLVDYAVRRKAQKRDGGRRAVPLEDAEDEILVPDERTDELVALDEAMRRLASVSERQCR